MKINNLNKNLKEKLRRLKNALKNKNKGSMEAGQFWRKIFGRIWMLA